MDSSPHSPALEENVAGENIAGEAASHLPASALDPNGAGGFAELVRLAWPLMIAQSFSTIQIFVDRLFLSRYDINCVSASMSAAMLFWMPFVLFQSTANYTTTFVAQYCGAGRSARVGPAVWQGIYFSLVAGIAFLLLLFAVDPLMNAIGHPDSFRTLEGEYLSCLCWAALPMLLTVALSSFFAGRGESRVVMFANGAGTLVNVVLDYCWIYGRGGFPEWGIAGAGWATVAASWASFLLLACVFLRRQYRAEFATLSGYRFEPKLFARMMRFGVPSGVSWFLDMTAFTLVVLMIGWLGDTAAAASSIALTINLLAFLPMMGMAQAVGILVGQRLGENRPDVAERSTRRGLLLACTYTGTMGIIYVVFPDLLIDLFRNDDSPESWAAIAETVRLLLIFIAVYCISDGFMMTFSFALRGAGDTLFVTLISLAWAWPVMVVPTYFAWRYEWGVYWVWGFASAYIVLSGFSLMLRFMTGKWRDMRVIEPEVVAEE